MYASQNGDLEVLRALIAAKANVNAMTEHGITALKLASQNGNLEVVSALLADKAEVNEYWLLRFVQGGNTALELASQNGHQDVVQLLKSAGAR